MSDDTNDIPEGYTYEPSTSRFVNEVGRNYHKTIVNEDGSKVHCTAIRVEERHVNTWGLAHGGFMAAVSEFMSAGAYEPGGPPVVAMEMSMQFIRAPKLGDLIETRSHVKRRTRSVVFIYAEAFVGDDIVFSASSLHKVVGA